MIRRYGRLTTPYKGYTEVEYIEPVDYNPYPRITVEICGSGKQIEVYEDEVEWYE